MNKKKLFFLIIFIITIIVFGFLLYQFFFKPTKKTGFKTRSKININTSSFPNIGERNIKEQKYQEGGQLPNIENIQKIKTYASNIKNKKDVQHVLEEIAVKAPSTDYSDNGVKFYNEIDGKFYKLNSNGTVELLSEKVFYNVKNVTWSPTKDESIIEFPDGTKIFYDFKNKRQSTIPKHWQNFSFSPQGDKVASKSIGLSPESNWLITSNPDGKDVKLVAYMGNNYDKVQVNWSPNKQILALSATGKRDDVYGFRQEHLLIGQHKQNFKSIIVEGRGLEFTWSPTGKKLLHSVYNPGSKFKPELWIINASGEDNLTNNGKKLLKINTWAHKCTMVDDRYAYCGVPEYLDEGAAFAPDLYTNTPDKLYKIDTVTGYKSEIPLDDTYTIDKIFSSKDGKYIYFADHNKTGLFKITIN